jgi:hypothetical protein
MGSWTWEGSDLEFAGCKKNRSCPKCNKVGIISSRSLGGWPATFFACCLDCKIKWSFLTYSIH